MPPFSRVFYRVLAAALIVTVFTMTAQGVITRLTPLKSIVDDSDQIVLVTVESIDPARPAMVLEATADIKGVTKPARIPVLLKGDAEGGAKQILDRVKAGSQMIFFITQGTDQHIGLLYCEGAWYQMIGHPNEGGARWVYTHGEPYLRRTFKDSTAQMHLALAAYLKDQKELPAVNPQEKPGLGPTLDGKPEELIESTPATAPSHEASPTAPATPAPSAAPASGPGTPVRTSLWISVAGGVLLVAVILMVLRRRAAR